MADGSDKREAERVASALRLKLKYSDVETFVDKFATNISKGGIFIATRQPKPAGTSLRFELLLENGQKLIRGEGVVSWVKDFDPKQPAKPHGMGVKFTKLDADSRVLVDRMLAVKQKRASSGVGGAGAATGDGVPVPVATSESGAVKSGAVATPSAPVNVLAIDSAPVPRETAKINGHAEGRKPGPPPPPPMALRGPGKAPPPPPPPLPEPPRAALPGDGDDDGVEIDIEAGEPPTAVMPSPLPPPEESTQMVPMAAFLGEAAPAKPPSPDEATQMVSMRSFLAEPPAAPEPAPPPDEATQMTSMASFLADLPRTTTPPAPPPRPLPAPPVLAPRAPAEPLAPPPALAGASASARVAELVAWGERELQALGGDDLDEGTVSVIAARARALAADVGDVSALGQPAPAAVPPSLDEAARGLGRLAKT